MKRIAVPLALLAVVLLGACQQQSAPAAEINSSFELVDESGRAVTAEDYAGRIRLVFFGYTYCPDICPITLHNIATALGSLGSLADQVTVLFISVDPKRDKPEILRNYTDAFHPSVVGLTGSYEQLQAVTRGFRTTFGFTLSRDGSDTPLDKNMYAAALATDPYIPFHSSQIYVLGRNGELFDIIGYGSKPSLIEARLRALLD